MELSRNPPQRGRRGSTWGNAGLFAPLTAPLHQLTRCAYDNYAFTCIPLYTKYKRINWYCNYEETSNGEVILRFTFRTFPLWLLSAARYLEDHIIRLARPLRATRKRLR